MVSLPDELREAVTAAGDGPVRLTDLRTRAEYVLLPAERYDDLERLKTYDDGPLTAKEKEALLIECGLRAGWDDPIMDIYDKIEFPATDPEAGS